MYLGNGGRIPVQPFAKIDFSLVAEGCDQLSGFHIEFLQISIHGKNQALIFTVFRYPMVKASIGRLPPLDRVSPDLLSGCSVERVDSVIFANYVHHAVDYQRIERESACRSGRGDKPRQLKLCHICFVNLLGRRISHGVGRAAIVTPGGVRFFLRSG